MTIVLIGMNHQTTPVELREKLFVTDGELRPALTQLHETSPALSESAILSTCNRLEIYGVASNVHEATGAITDYLCNTQQIPQNMLRDHLTILQDKAAITHLMRVAAGLESMILGEPQILGQVTSALTHARSAETIGPILDRLFTQAVHTGKRARSETEISQNTVSVGHAAARLVQQRFKHLNDAHVLIIGAGEIAQRGLKAFKNHGVASLAIINRTRDRADVLARRINGYALDWDQLQDAISEADIILSATGAPQTILSASDVQSALSRRDGRDLIFVDLAVPRDIDDSVANLPGVSYYDIDDLLDVVDGNLAQREACIPAVEAIIAQEVNNYLEWLYSRRVVPVITGLRGKVAAIAEDEVEEALHRLSHLDAREREVITRMAHRIVNKVLHEPTIRLKQQAANCDGDKLIGAVEDLFALYDPAEERPAND